MLYDIEAGIMLSSSRVIEAESEDKAREIAEDMVGAGEWDFSYESLDLVSLEAIGSGADGIDFHPDDRPVYTICPRLTEEVKRSVVRERYRLACEQNNVIAGAAYQAGFMAAMAYLGHLGCWVSNMNDELSDLMNGYIDGEWE